MRRLKYWGRDSLIKEVNDHFLKHYPARYVADLAGVTPGTIRKLQLPVSKGGTRFVRAITIRKILKGFGYDLKIRLESDTD